MQTSTRAAFDWKAVAGFKFIQLVVYIGSINFLPKGTAGLFLYALLGCVLFSAFLIQVQHMRNKWLALKFNSQSVFNAQIFELLLYILFTSILPKGAAPLILYALTCLTLGVAFFMYHLEKHHRNKK